MKKTSVMGQKVKIVGLIVIVLALIALGIGTFSSADYVSAFRIVFGSVYVLFLPGFLISYLFFPYTHSSDERESGSIDWIERIALSFGLSIAIVPLMVFYLNLIGMSISVLSSFLTILAILLISGGLVWYRFSRLHR